MREIILKVLGEVACGNTGTCQINLQSESAQIMIADKLEKELRPFMQSMMEEVFCSETDTHCCGGDCHADG